MCSFTSNASSFLEGEKPETKQKRLEQKYAQLQVIAAVEKLGNAKVRYLVNVAIQKMKIQILNVLITKVCTNIAIKKKKSGSVAALPL